MRYTMNTNEKHDTPIELIEFIKTGMDRVSGSFFSVVTCGDVKPIARERVYCYELYHQMRSIQENDNKYPSLCKYILHAEIDKSGHPRIHNNFNPDMIIHTPGTMDNNLAVIEVKSANKIKGIIKDFQTLKCMLKCYGYKYGIFISTGFSLKELSKSNISKIYSSISELDTIDNRIHILSQTGYGKTIEHYMLHDIFDGAN